MRISYPESPTDSSTHENHGGLFMEYNIYFGNLECGKTVILYIESILSNTVVVEFFYGTCSLGLWLFPYNKMNWKSNQNAKILKFRYLFTFLFSTLQERKKKKGTGKKRNY